MKFASYKDGSRDGQLVVVSQDLETAHFVSEIVHTMQELLDDWNFLSPQLQDVYVALNQGKLRHAFAFNPQMCMAPLPRAYQWADGSAYLNHVELVRSARGATVPESFYQDPLFYQGGSDDFIGPCDDVVCASESFGIDFEAELAVITGDVSMGSSPEETLEGVRLLMLVNDVSLRNLIPEELSKGFGFYQSKPATAFGPVAITPDELGSAWMGGRVHLTLQSSVNQRKVGMCEAGEDGALLVTHHVPIHKPIGEVFPFGKVVENVRRWNAALNKSGYWPYGVCPRTMILVTSNVVGTEVSIKYYRFPLVIRLPDLVLQTARDSYRDWCATHNTLGAR